jgi:hypothetical protein
MLEMVRDRTGTLTELKTMDLSSADPDQADSPLLDAFIAGFQTAKDKPLQ